MDTGLWSVNPNKRQTHQQRGSNSFHRGTRKLPGWCFQGVRQWANGPDETFLGGSGALFWRRWVGGGKSQWGDSPHPPIPWNQFKVHSLDYWSFQEAPRVTMNKGNSQGREHNNSSQRPDVIQVPCRKYQSHHLMIYSPKILFHNDDFSKEKICIRVHLWTDVQYC